MTAPPRVPNVVLREAVGHLAWTALHRHYDEQPRLWELGEQGRARTLEDYGHHFTRLATLEPAIWTDHLRYCDELWLARGFPVRWLVDAFRIMDGVLRDELDPAVAAPARQLLGAPTPWDGRTDD